MYSAVLMTALVATAATPSWHRSGCNVHHGCYGGHAVYNCHGGCYGQAIQGYGAAGGCYGYHGGCASSFGNTYGYGAPHGYAMPEYQCTGCYGCYGGHSGYGIPVPAPVQVIPAPVVKDSFPPINPKKGDKKPEEVPAPKEKGKKGGGKVDEIPEGLQSRATLRIEVPVGGKLIVDGRTINVGAGTHTFRTPALAPQERYFYDIRIELEQAGQIRREERRVIIESGDDALVSFPALGPSGPITAQTRP